MRYRSRKPKPPVGMELTVTLSLPAENSSEQDAAALLKFFEAVQTAATTMGAPWIRLHCSGIPIELEDVVRAGLDAAERRPKLTLAVDNTTSVDGQQIDGKSDG